MYTTTRRKLTILAIVVVAATVLTVLASTTFTSSAFAAKTSGNKNLKNLFACQSSAANGHFGQLTATEVMDCYSQAFSSSHGASGINNTPASDTGSGSSTNSTNSGSTSPTHTVSSSSHTHHHHHSSTSSSSLPGCHLQVHSDHRYSSRYPLGT